MLTLLLLVVAVAGGLVFALGGAGPNVQGQLNAQKSAQLVAQAQLIGHRIVKCATDYPEGDNGSGLHKAYPAGSGALVASLTCPGNSQNLWSGADGVYLPTSPTGFEAGWTYTNANPAIVSITTSQPATYSSAIAAAAARIGTAATATADTLTVNIIE